jgi:hypothetical protein
MTEDTLSWVLGGMLALGAVVAIAAGLPDPAPAGVPPAPHTAASVITAEAAPSTLSASTVQATPSASSASTAQATPGAASPSTAQPAPSAPSAASPAAPADVSPVVVSTSARPQLPRGQVWECDIDGQRVFSDVQCGAHATVRQLTELNVIDSAAAYPRGTPRPDGYAPGPGSPGPGSPGPGYYPQPLPSEAPPNDSDAGDPLYTQVIVVRDHLRREQLAHHGNRPHPRAAHPAHP